MTEVTPENNTPQAAPTSREAPLLGMGDQAHFQRYQQNSNKVLWGIFALLFVLAGGVFFVLPALVTPPDPASAVVVVPTATGPTAPALSPFDEAQKMRQREGAQNALAVLLELQEELETKQVLDWAAAPFNAALDQARLGDEAYRTQQFIDANTLYQAGADALQSIKDGEGLYIAPTIFDGVKPNMTIAKEEIFGPVLSVITVNSTEEAVQVANDTSYGLQASLFTANVRSAHRVSRALQAGTVTVNCYGEGDITTPFGGYKLSGFGGRDNSLKAHDQYTETKTIWIDLSDRHMDETVA